MPRPRALLRPWPQLRRYTTGEQRELFRRVAQPVALLTAHLPQHPDDRARTGHAALDREPLAIGVDEELHNHGATLSSLTSISLSPALISFSLRLPSRLAAHLASSSPSSTRPTFRVHLLSRTDEDLARLFARQVPLPGPALPSPTTDWSTEPSFDRDVFLKLAQRETGLGALECTVVDTVDLWTIGSRNDDDDDRNRSQLFIARVDEVSLVNDDVGRGREGKRGSSLVWCEQQYRSIQSQEE